jgi:predicted AlkP superfamily pyrophosphatase or phosphodiesterase
LPKRVLGVVVVAALVAGAAFWLLRKEEALPSSALTQEEMARSVGGPVMLDLVRGHVPGRSGDIMLVPKPNNYMISEWDLRTLEGDTPELKTTHPGPWSYLARVPIVLRGPGIAQGREVARAVDITSIAPTYAAMLGMDGFTSPSPPLDEIQTTSALKAIVTVVIDGGGWNLLDRYPNAWPNISRLMSEGTTFTSATIGSAPSTTGALHATFGSGYYPMQHGIPGNVLRDDDNEIVDVFYGKDSDLRYLKVPTVSELWDESNDNEAVVGTVSVENWHLGMIGKGSLREGGDKDLAAFWDREKEQWFVNEEYFTLPPALAFTDLDRLTALESEMDGRDGSSGDGWFGHDIDEIAANKNERPSTPAFTRFMGKGVIDVMEEARVGEDAITDLFWIEMKMPDSAGHAWNMIDPEVGDVLRQTDVEVGRLIDSLDRRLGRDGYVFTLSADHGQQPLADEDSGWRINTSELERDIVARFGDVVLNATPADLYLDLDGLDKEGVSAEEIALWIGTYTIADNIPDGAPGESLVPAERLDETLYAAAFTGEFLADPPIDIESLGAGDYGEDGDLPVVYNLDG